MKYLLIFLCSLFHFQDLSCQDWCRQGAVWHYNYYTFGGAGYFRYSYEKDTVIQTIPCNKIAITAIIATGFPFPAIDTDDYAPLYTFRSNDTVFFFNPYADTFRPTYFFGANQGDTVSYFDPRPWHCPSDSIYHYVIEEKGVLTINAQNLSYYRARLINYTANFLYPDTIRVIERIGSTEAMQPYHSCVTDDGEFSLRCYQDDSFYTYQTDVNTPCNYILSVPSYTNFSVLPIYPNPADGFIVINTNLKTYGTVYNSLSAVVHHFVVEGSAPIDISFLPSGFYYIKAEDSQKIGSASFIKR